MCIAVFMWEAHPLYPLLLFLNRDEYHNRQVGGGEYMHASNDIIYIFDDYGCVV